MATSERNKRGFICNDYQVFIPRFQAFPTYVFVDCEKFLLAFLRIGHGHLLHLLAKLMKAMMTVGAVRGDILALRELGTGSEFLGFNLVFGHTGSLRDYPGKG